MTEVPEDSKEEPSPVMTEVYVGSTTQSLEARWNIHLRAYKQRRLVSIYPYFEEHGIENFKIELIREYDVVDEKHLRVYETLWMNRLICVNKKIPFMPMPLDIYQRLYYERNKEDIIAYGKEYRERNREVINACHKEYREQNREVINARHKEHYARNRDKIAAMRKEKVICECGAVVARGGLSAHRKTVAHIRSIQSE